MIDLKYVVEKYPEKLFSRTKLAALLHDLYPEEKLSTNVALITCESGFFPKLIGAPNISAREFEIYVKQLMDEFGLQEQYAIEGIEMWAEALNIPFSSPKEIITTKNRMKSEHPSGYLIQSCNSDRDVFSSHWFSGTILERLPMGYEVFVPGIGKGFLPNALSPEEALSIGQTVQMKITPYEKARIMFSMRKNLDEIWAEVEKKYQVNNWYPGVIEEVIEHGIFVQLEKWVTGLVHESCIPNFYEGIIREKYAVGDSVSVRIIEIDSTKRRMLLSLKDEIWADIEKYFQLNKWYTGVIEKVYTFGFFVQLDDEVYGLVHKNSIPNFYKGIIGEKYAIGDSVSVRIIEIDSARRRMQLSLK